MADDDSEGMPSGDAGADAGAPRLKQAVVVIHGMGEQRPMQTLRSFVEAVWTRDAQLVPPHRADDGDANRTWITPDTHTGSHELRRVTTGYDVNGRRTDFFELYWADLTQGSTRGRLVAWVKELLWRSDIPDDAFRLYLATLFVVILYVAAALVLSMSVWLDWLSPLAAAIVVAVASALFWALDHFVLPYFGDVASYVQATPQTVATRAAVRERGLALLRGLSDDPLYDRIVVVSHSLGTILAYDLVQLLWAERRPRGLQWPRDRAVTDAVRAVEAYAVLPREAPAAIGAERRAGFRAAQWQLHEALRTLGPGRAWKISDLVTLGSPLTHAEFLLARNEEALRQGAAERLFSLCPPLSDSASEPRLLYYERPRERAVHHGAAFAATRWTNLYDIGNLLTTGDPISGEMAGNFGAGVEDVRLKLRGRLGRVFTHTLYWSTTTSGAVVGDDGNPGGRGHLDALRDAVDLRRVHEVLPVVGGNGSAGETPATAGSG